MRGVWYTGLGLAVLTMTGCVPPGGGGGGGDPVGGSERDCRLAAFACAPGFACVDPSGTDRWRCQGTADGGPPPGDASPDDASPDDASPEGSDDAGRVTDDAGSTTDEDAGPRPDRRSGPGGPCQLDADCRVGRCLADPGGRCVVACDDDADCGPDAACITEVDDSPTCVERCADAPCRDGWICADLDDRLVCLADCAVAGCPDGLDCRVDGICAPPMCVPVAERCDGRDDDCDARVDEGAPCAAGSRCEAGRCRALAGPAAACNRDADCASGACVPPAELPGGFCYADCLDDRDCGPDAICALINADGGSICGQPCGFDDCRGGWVCVEPGVCLPGCEWIGCDAGLVCGDDGYCETPLARVILEQVFIAPAKPEGTPWDGFGSVSPQTIQAATAALGAANPIAVLLGVFGAPALDAYDAPDPRGTATLFVDGRDIAFNLPEFDDTYTPAWRGVEWPHVPMDPAVDLRLRIQLIDVDLVNDDAIGTVSLNGADLRAAMAAGGVFPVNVNGQNPAFLLVAVSVIPE